MNIDQLFLLLLVAFFPIGIAIESFASAVVKKVEDEFARSTGQRLPYGVAHKIQSGMVKQLIVRVALALVPILVFGLSLVFPSQALMVY